MASPNAKPDLLELGQRLLAQGPVKTLRTPKRIRIQFGSTIVADTTSALYVWEHAYYPFYYVPLSAFREGLLQPEEGTVSAPFYIAHLTVGSRTTDRILVFARRSNNDDHDHDKATTAREGGKEEEAEELAGLVRVEFSAAPDLAWFEEDERIYVHPRDPYKRIDALPSTRPVRVFVRGRLVARAPAAVHLYETGLPVRYYLPATSVVDLGLVRDSATTTQCPYKGEANYYSVVLPSHDDDDDDDPEKKKKKEGGEEVVVKDVIWYYKTPTHESARIAGLLCFYNERVDIELDGKMLERPKSIFA